MSNCSDFIKAIKLNHPLRSPHPHVINVNHRSRPVWGWGCVRASADKSFSFIVIAATLAYCEYYSRLSTD